MLSRRCETGFLHGLQTACQEMLAKWENAEVGPASDVVLGGGGLESPSIHTALLRFDLVAHGPRQMSTQYCVGLGSVEFPLAPSLPEAIS